MLSIRLCFLAALATLAHSTPESKPRVSWPSTNTLFHQYGGSEEGLWSGWGGDILNNRWAAGNTAVDSTSIKKLTTKACRKTYLHGVSATPTVGGDGTVYYPTWDGWMVALDYVNCKVRWQINVTDIALAFAPRTALNGGISGASRTSPQVHEGVLYFGTLWNALLVAVKVADGTLLDTIQINSNQFAQITMAPTFYGGKIFVGCSSGEESAAFSIKDYKCCSFVGNMAAFTFEGRKFHTSWNVPMIPDALVKQGWSGSALWGSQPAIDVKRGQVFVATGNTYSVPDVISDCQQRTANISAIEQGLVPEPCLPEAVWQESVISFDMEDGMVNWLTQLSPLDSWTVACGIPQISLPKKPSVCPGVAGPDADFGMAPTFVPGGANTPYRKDIVVVGQKNGNLHALNAQTGRLFWSTATSPDSVSGGLSWGIAVDDTRAYFTGINWAKKTFQTVPAGVTVNNSVYGAASLKDGSLLWEVAAPDGYQSVNPPTVVGDVVITGKSYGDSTHLIGSLVALNKATGAFVAELPLDASFYGGVAVQGRYVMFGSGYSSWTSNASFYVAQV